MEALEHDPRWLMQPAKYILQSQYSLLIYISNTQWQQNGRGKPRTIFVSEGYWQKLSVETQKIDNFETNFLGNSATDLRAGVPLIVFKDLSCSFHLLVDFKWNISSRHNVQQGKQKEINLSCTVLQYFEIMTFTTGRYFQFQTNSLTFSMVTSQLSIVFSS